MKERAYFTTAATIFGIVAILHLLRSIYASPFLIGDFIIPLWISWLAVALTAFMSFEAIRLAKNKS